MATVFTLLPATALAAKGSIACKVHGNVITFSGTGTLESKDFPEDKEIWWIQDEISRITEVVVGNGITSIGSEAFSGVPDNIDIKTVRLPESVTRIEDYGFEYLRGGLDSIELPDQCH